MNEFQLARDKSNTTNFDQIQIEINKIKYDLNFE